ncbi:ribonuclease HII [Pseudidiomarina sp. 1APP75-32.1]|uniref:Ribonuclease HII n=1 Tax=Pseudidiomarina terrestris TaxID=2820060 RepID=A0AAW7QXZ3_9GAMM|nr:MULTISPECIES: ribonuclease HII [unclassified Pseudidiomarina]MDN7123938.1 ribonuclease HII [Pseudidiomarina sp. 1APP75-32.1]MDN7127692.1 ribonuclease HII [Pseudidiomarina sp. 1APR75-33.1]MDN7130438.1 ribonuclease HII [Pseudidiomarina sp. 1APR75-15]MDN7138722.1 ribonuclease HII [Pseudidiomarina sp. 1ASP75-14]MEA3588815.1 ribonuclease HII [Pseudidiomarina sp. 1APP75-27a]
MICGTDEAGRGPIAGPVVAAAVILDPRRPILGINDSKKLSEKKREALSQEIKEKALYWSIAQCDADEIDAINILQASLLAMQRAVEGLGVTPEKVLVDGNRLPKLIVPGEAIIGGDGLHECIGAASILAKVERDRQMLLWHAHYPDYDFARHKAYPTPGHLELLQRFGACPIHRRSFKPVRRVLGEID